MGFREDLNVKVYNVRRTDGRRTPSDGKSSPGLWPGELKRDSVSVTDCLLTSPSPKPFTRFEFRFF
jgi:hypothetical protein